MTALVTIVTGRNKRGILHRKTVFQKKSEKKKKKKKPGKHQQQMYK